MKRLVFPAVLAGVLVLAGAAFGQSDRGGRVKITLGSPANGETRSTLGTPVLGFGLGYDIPTGGRGNGSFVPATSVEYVSKSRTKDDKRVDLRYIAVIGEGRYFFGSETKTTGFGVKTRTPTGFYVGIGTGFYFLKYKRQESGVTRDDSGGVKFGYKGLLGVQIKNGLYLEADYTNPGNSRAALYNLSIGYRVSSNAGG